MKVILSMAVSANGIIATKDGSEDFLSNVNWQQFVKLAKEVGCFIYGRKTYENVITWDNSYLDPLKDVKKLVISKSDFHPQEGFTIAHSPEEALQLLEKEGLQEVIVTGGSTISSEFAKRGLIDEVILDVNPSIIGEGIPVFFPADIMMKLELVKFEKIGGDIIEIHYTVKKSS